MRSARPTTPLTTPSARATLEFWCHWLPTKADADAWVRVYRGSSHGHAVRNLQRHRASLSPDGQNFAITLDALYQARLSADYDPRSIFNRQIAERRLTQAEEAIEKLMQLPRSERIVIATITLLRDR